MHATNEIDETTEILPTVEVRSVINVFRSKVISACCRYGCYAGTDVIFHLKLCLQLLYACVSECCSGC